MSFITKRERVFNEYDLLDLPPRNEGKLKAYASCTDARAWSHFCSDKTEHLVEIIKRNNDICRPKYLPTDVIVQTLMAAKNAEISRLKRKIQEFEQMLATYDQLELTCEQKCEIANAHAAIKAANKELDELCLDLDLSGFTEGMDSDAFETGKSRGDEPSRYRGDEAETSRGSESVKSRGDEWIFDKEPPKTETKSNQTDLACPCDASTSAVDPRIQDMQDTIISKDAKLSAMRNTIAVMENDVCEPYCIYAHIYTALEKIFGVLCQNDKYKLYLNLMTAGKDIRCIDIKGKILFKLKVLEKFGQALIAPCSQQGASSSSLECACLRAEVTAHFENPPLTSETKLSNLDNKRAQLVADIMANDEMKEILSKDSCSDKNDDDSNIDDGVDNYSIDTENLKRLKLLQQNYDELMTCYEKVKYEKDCLQVRCSQYEELEKEYEILKNQLINEKEHYRKRSVDIDSLKEQYWVLLEETSNLETQLKAETEINSIKSNTVEDLRSENIELEKKVNDSYIAFEKEKNSLQCKLKEAECTIMCQEQQIKSLSGQIDRLLEQGHDKMLSAEDATNSLAVINEIESLKEKVNNLKDSLICSEDEKQQLLEQFQDKLRIINDLKMEIEDWKITCQRLMDENKTLYQDAKEKSVAVENLRSIVDKRSQEIDLLMEELEKKDNEKRNISEQYQDLRDMYDNSITANKNEKFKVLRTIHLARRESQELLKSVNGSNNKISDTGETSKSIEIKQKRSQELTAAEKLCEPEDDDSILLNEIQKLKEVNSLTISTLNEERTKYKVSLELMEKESEIMVNKLKEFQQVSEEMESLKFAQDNIIKEKHKLEDDLKEKKDELLTALQSLHLSRKKSDELFSQLNHFKTVEEELIKLGDAYNQLLLEKEDFKNELLEKNKEIENVLQSLRNQSEALNKGSIKLSELENELSNLKFDHIELRKQNSILQNNLDNKTKEIENLNDGLETTKKENFVLRAKIHTLESNQKTANENIIALKKENTISQTNLDDIRKESAALVDKLKHFESLEDEYEKLKGNNESMQNELTQLTNTIKKIQRDNNDLSDENQNLQAINKNLEKSLIEARNQLLAKPGSPRLSTEDILKEIEKLKTEKLQSQNKIKDLLMKLEESDNVISDLSERLLARDDKIATLENHINKLEEEIMSLQENLAKVIEASEEISTNSMEKYDQTLQNLNAHHSKAAHNIKMELAKLQNENMKLEEQLSMTKIKKEESHQDKNKYLSRVTNLQREREIIVTDIKQLEVSSIGDSTLSPEQCDLDDILASLDRIRKHIYAKAAKSSSLEQTIHKVQTSSQILLGKADEAKKIVEMEKQKIIMEKEEAIRQKTNMENKLAELRKNLEDRIAQDQEVIKDLEADIQNQQLLSENSISLLKTKIQTLQSMNKSSLSELEELQKKNQTLQSTNQSLLTELEELQKKNQNLTDDNKQYIRENNLLKSELTQKTASITELQKEFHALKNKTPSLLETSIQTENPLQRSILIQTENYEIATNENSVRNFNSDLISKDKYEDNLESLPPANIFHSNIGPMENVPVPCLLPNETPHSINEVQILATSFEPTFNFKRSNYLNYKIKQLRHSKLEQHSFFDEQLHEKGFHNSNLEKPENNYKLVDIYNRSINHTSSKFLYNNDNVDRTSKLCDNDSEQGQKINQSPNNKFDLPNDGAKTNNYDDNDKESLKQQNKDYKDLLTTVKGNVTESTDNVIKGKDVSATANDKQKENELVIKQRKDKVKNYKQSTVPATFIESAYIEDDIYDEDDSVKPKLKINLPRINNESHSLLTTSEGDRKSTDSDTLDIYSSPKQSSIMSAKLFSDTEIKITKQENLLLPSMSNENMPSSSFNIKMMNTELERKYNNQQDMRIDELRNQIFELTNRDKNLSDDDLELIRRNKKMTIESNDSEKSHHDLSRVDAEVYLMKPQDKKQVDLPVRNSIEPRSFALDYILNTVRQEVYPRNTNITNEVRESPKSLSDERLYAKNEKSKDWRPSKCNQHKMSFFENQSNLETNQSGSKISGSKSAVDRSVMAEADDVKDYEERIRVLTKSLEITERDYKRRLSAIKSQYDSNITSIIKEHNQGVKNIQGLHEQTLQDIIKIHENEIENLRTMSLEANRKAEKLERENFSLKSKIKENSKTGLDEEPIKIPSDLKKGRKSRSDTKTLTKTDIVACNVKPKIKSFGPCTCSLDVNISDTIKNIFEQVSVSQRKMAEHSYIKYIINKMLSGNVEDLDAQELSFLHLKVCRAWKMKLSKEEALQKRIDNLESELINRQRHAQQHIAELDRKVEEEKRRLQEVREAVCRSPPGDSRTGSPEPTYDCMTAAPLSMDVDNDNCGCNTGISGVELKGRRSAGDLSRAITSASVRSKRTRVESNRAVLVKIDTEEKRERRPYHDDPPTRLRRSYDRQMTRKK
ncbi:hypothetical protein evm_000775 [Chilo suppressalis]|nr:hypothetical protein evm_000775 [Chilo suppressalis]